MRIAIGLCVALFCFVLPASSAPIQVGYGGATGNRDFVWGTERADIYVMFEGMNAGALEVDGQSIATLAVAPTFRSFEVEDAADGDGKKYTKATYTGGMLEVTSTWDLPSGEFGTGSLRASIRELVIDLVEDPSGWPYPLGYLYIYLGPGEMDASLARLLGVPRGVLGGEMWIGLDYVYPFLEDLGDTWERDGAWNGTDLDITVPEPATVLLLITGAVAAAVRRARLLRTPR